MASSLSASRHAMAHSVAASVAISSSSTGCGLPPEILSGIGTHAAPKASPMALAAQRGSSSSVRARLAIEFGRCLLNGTDMTSRNVCIDVYQQ